MKSNSILVLALLISLTSMCFLCAAYANDSIVQKKALEDPNNPDVYIKICGQTLVFSYYDLFGLFKNGKAVSKKDKNSLEMPLEADDVSFIIDVTLPGYERPYSIQYFLKADSKGSNNWLSEIKEQLASQGKKIEDLPKRGNFYRYVYSSKHNFAHYISRTRAISNSDGEPIVLNSCGKETSILECQISFDWRSGIRVNVKKNEFPQNLPKPDSIDIWLQAYPIYLKNLNEYVAQSSGDK